MYDRTTSLFAVNEARCKFLPRKQRHCDVVPPTRVFFGGHPKSSVSRRISLGSAWFMYQFMNTGVGWKKKIDDSWEPKRTSSAAVKVASSCRELLKWGGEKSSCVGDCKCYRSVLPCTSFVIGYCPIILRYRTCLSNKTRHLILTKNVISLVKLTWLMKIIKKNTFSKILPPFWNRKSLFFVIYVLFFRTLGTVINAL